MSTWREELETEFGKDLFRSGFSGEVVSSGSFVVDFLTEIGGFPLGSIVEVFGEEGSGKTTLVLSAIKEALDKGLPVLYEDYESTVSDDYLRKLGIDPKKLENYRVFPETMEDGWMVIKRFCEKYTNGLIVVDSLAAMPPKFDIGKMKKVIGETKVASAAAVMSIALKQMTGVVKRRNMCLIFVNQERSQIDIMRQVTGKKTTPGGAAVKYFAALRIQTRLQGAIKVEDVNILSGEKGSQVAGIRVLVSVIKNKFGASYRVGHMFLRMNEGIDNILSIARLAIQAGFIQEKRGGRFIVDERYSGDTLGGKKAHGIEQLRLYFKNNPEEWYKLLADINKYLLEEQNKE